MHFQPLHLDIGGSSLTSGVRDSVAKGRAGMLRSKETKSFTPSPGLNSNTAQILNSLSSGTYNPVKYSQTPTYYPHNRGSILPPSTTYRSNLPGLSALPLISFP